MDKIWSLPPVSLLSLTEVEDRRPATVVTTPPAFELVGKKIQIPVTSVLEVREATRQHWDALLALSQPSEVIYAVGGGLAFDAAKYLAVKQGLPLVGIPTALSVDAIFAWSSAIREEGCVRYIETKTADLLIVDLEFIASAPPHLRAAGICDLLSIATGCSDWRLADLRGQNPPSMTYHAAIEKIAHSILEATIDCAPSAGKGDPQGLKQLLDCLALETQLLNQIGHARPEEGSEHYFAYLAENYVGKGRSHAELVCPGILLMAALQGQDVAILRQAMRQCHVPLNSLDPNVIQVVLRELPEYVRRHALPYGIAHEITEEKIKQLDLAQILG
ncbi:MAG: iron-containing alcohol dehydrogenase [Anaerolineales bacterium]|nr:iron-containing alcohol dehydrogenase [Anaerolineales bacterium]MCS7248335.1 iron-containing alcohol dehydrogenase [Anaerolineales bacterium]MDW8162148.1 iron-containing alcohol dehydrogenase [Anaerolineales bacterium]MDW8447277.1 iron-containing alcohol dehydrogenase [Anaerolineales bacterium]